MPSPNLSEIITTTLRDRSGVIKDNVTNHNALFKRLHSKGKMKPATGRTIVEELDYATNTTVKAYSGYEQLDISPQDVITAAEFNWKQYAGAVTISGLEEVQNSGKEAVLNLLEARLTNLDRSLANTMATDVYGDGTGTNGKALGGLQLLVADDPSAATLATVGGINAATYTFWQNQKVSFSVEGLTSTNDANFKEAMNLLWIRTIRGKDTPDMFVADEVYFKAYLRSLQAIQRINSPTTGEAGFMQLDFMGKPFFYDDQAPASHVYALNTDYLSLRYHPQRDFTPLDPRDSINQDATVRLVVWAGNLCVSNRARQGVLIA